MRIWALPAKLPLRRLLTVPYVLLVVLIALVIGLLSYRSGRNIVDNLSGQLLVETVNRIAQAVDRHVSGSAAVLEAAFPKGVVAPASIQDDMAALRTRFWLATSVHRDPNNYAYYGDRHGNFFGLWRFSDSDAELRLRSKGEGPRDIYRFTGIAGPLGTPAPENKLYDPRVRPWFNAAQSGTSATWTSIYIDFKTLELVATRARRVNNAADEFEGVVATDLSLKQVNSFLSKLALSANGVAIVLEPNGNLIGVSRGPHLKSMANGEQVRLNATESREPLVAAAYKAVRELEDSIVGNQPRTAVFKAEDGSLVQLGYARLRDDAGLDWLILVAVPRHDFLAEIERNVVNTAVLAVLAAIVVALIGLGVLAIVTRELSLLAKAAKEVGEGHLYELPNVHRQDELGELARSFADMQSRLLTDQLTGLSNRTAVVRRIDDRILQQRRREDPRPFVVLFVDFNRFKQVNDRFGHDVGDAVLRELSLRLRAGVRSHDMVARYAGDEFVILLESVERRSDAEAVRAHLERELLLPMDALASLAPEEAGLGAALGMAIYPDDGLDADSLIKHADKDMYSRKPGGEAPVESPG